MKKHIPYSKQSIDARDIAAVVRALTSPLLTQGEEVKKFEAALAKVTSAKYAVAVSNGTAALHIAYMAAGLKRGDEVIMPANTFAATANMLLALGIRPVICDIRRDTYNIDESKIEALITPKTKAIVPVHFAGYPSEMDKIKRIAKKHKLCIIEDGAHAIGARYKKIPVGSIGNMTTFSFHPVKPITTGEGGAVTTNDKDLYTKLLLYRSHGIERDKEGQNQIVTLGFNYRLTELQSALGSSQLLKLPSFEKKRERIAGRYMRELASIPELSLPTYEPTRKHAWHLFVVCTEKRDALFSYLRSEGIGVQIHYPAVYKHPYYQKEKNLRLGEHTVAEEYTKTCLSLPLYPDLTSQEQERVIAAIKAFFRNQK